MSDPDDHVPRRKGIYRLRGRLVERIEHGARGSGVTVEPERPWVLIDATREWAPVNALGVDMHGAAHSPIAAGLSPHQESDVGGKAYWSRRLGQKRCAPPPGGSPRPGIDFQIGPNAARGSMPNMCPCNCGNPMAQGPHAGLSAETVAYIERWNRERQTS